MTLRRSQLTPNLTDTAPLSLDDILEHLRLWQADTLECVDALAVYQQRVDDQAKQLESPKAVAEYIAFFTDFLTRAAAELQRIASELPAGLQQAHLDGLRQLASNAAAEQRRCVMFRDKWINRPLPYEQVRAMLNQLSIDTRDQLADLRELQHAADRLAALAGPVPKTEESAAIDRRALFNRLLGRDKDARPGER